MHTDSYLFHLIGGYDSEVRRRLVGIFDNPPSATKFVIGAIEEFRNINVSYFSVNNIIQTLEVFDMLHEIPYEVMVGNCTQFRSVDEFVRSILDHPLIAIDRYDSVYYITPELQKINRLVSQFCVRVE